MWQACISATLWHRWTVWYY